MSRFYRKTSVKDAVSTASNGSISAVIDKLFLEYSTRVVTVNSRTGACHRMTKGTVAIILRLGFPHILDRCAVPQKLSTDAFHTLTLMNHRAIRALETYIAVYEAMGWEPPGSPKRLLKTISEIQGAKIDPLPELFEQVVRMMAIVCASKDVFFFHLVGRWALGMQSQERVDDESLVGIEGSTAPIREKFDLVDRLFAAALEALVGRGVDWPPPEVPLTKERCTFVHWNFACVLLRSVGEVSPKLNIQRCPVVRVPATLLHIIGDHYFNDVWSAKLRQTYQVFCGHYDPAYLAEEVVAYEKACCNRGHDCVPYSLNPEVPVRDFCRGPYDTDNVLREQLEGDATFDLTVRSSEESFFRAVAGLSVSEKPSTLSGHGRVSGGVPPEDAYRRLVLELHYTHGWCKRAISLQKCHSCKSGWIVASGRPWWSDYSPYEPDIPVQELASHAHAAGNVPHSNVSR